MNGAEELLSRAENKQKSGKYGEAVELYLNAAKKLEEANNWEGCSLAYAKAGLLFESIHKNSEASNCLLKTVTMLHKLSREDERVALYLSHLGLNFFILEKFEKAAESYTRSAKIYEKNKLFRNAVESYWRAGFSYKQKANYKKAESCYKKSLQLSQQSDDKYQQATVLGLLGILYGDAMNRYEEAAAQYLKSGELFKELGEMNEARDKYLWAFQSYLNAGKVEEAEKLMASINKFFPENNQYYI